MKLLYRPSQPVSYVYNFAQMFHKSIHAPPLPWIINLWAEV